MLILFLTSFLLAQNNQIPQIGIYQCLSGNNPDICEQRLEKIYGDENEATAIKLSYVGYCGDQGPYFYFCLNLECSDASIKINFKDSSNYFWENTTYGFNCLMSLKKE